MAKRLSQAIETRNLEHPREGRTAFRTLIAPIAHELRHAAMLCIIPTGELWNLSFAALIDEQGRYLLDRYGVFYEPSIAAFLHLAARNRGDDGASLLAIANPKVSSDATRALKELYHGSQFGPLPEAEKEARLIAAMYKQRSTVLAGSEATEEAVRERANASGILHFAAHGIFDDRNPMYSRLLLAGSENSDGHLEAREVIATPTNARMVILSACDTARRQSSAGEGLLGLSWAFLAAGTRSVVASKWRIDSKAAAELMVGFHERMLRGQAPPEALRQAQRTLMERPRYDHPFYWASFILLGAP